MEGVAGGDGALGDGSAMVEGGGLEEVSATIGGVSSSAGRDRL